MNAETCQIYEDKEIVNKTAKNNPRIVAIDAPLCLPPGRKFIEERTTNHLRESDRALMKMGIKIFPITLGPMRKLTLRGIHIKSLFEAQNFTVIEAYPGGAQDVLGIPRKQHGLDKLKSGLEKLGIKGLNSGMIDHEIDAVTCAYVGKLLMEGKAVTYGAINEGIVMPKGEKLKK
jgi:predicted nuclease with RNAse H fold